MKASEVLSKLNADASAKSEALAAMRAERVSLALPANSGDAEAALRIADLRADIATAEADMKDLAQAINDVGPAVAVERARELLALREAQFLRFEARTATALATMKAVDAEVARLGPAYREAFASLAGLREEAVAFTVPDLQGVSNAHVAQRRMEAGLSIRFDTFPDRFDHAVSHACNGKPWSLVGVFAEMFEFQRRRMVETLRNDRAAAERAGVVRDPSNEEAA